MKEVRVLQLIDSLEIGGAEVLAVNINNMFVNDEKIISFLCATRLEGELKERISNLNSYFFLNKKSVIDIPAILKLIRFIKKNNIDIIHAHSSSYFLATLVKLFYQKVKIIWHDHYGLSEQLHERKKQPLNFLSFFFSAGIFVNNTLLIWAKRNLNIKKYFLLNNFIIFNKEEKVTFLQGIANKRIVCVAAFRPQKDHINLLKGFKKVLNKYPDWSLHLIGKENNSNYFLKIKKYLKDNNLDRNVFFYGACADIKHILLQCTIGVLSSFSEGLPLSLLEYGLAGLPVVVTDVGDCKKVVRRDCGIIVEKQNSTKLAKGILNLIKSKEKRTKFGMNLKDVVEKEYSVTQFKNKLFTIYQQSL